MKFGDGEGVALVRVEIGGPIGQDVAEFMELKEEGVVQASVSVVGCDGRIIDALHVDLSLHRRATVDLVAEPDGFGFARRRDGCRRRDRKSARQWLG